MQIDALYEIYTCLFGNFVPVARCHRHFSAGIANNAFSAAVGSPLPAQFQKALQLADVPPPFRPVY